MAVPRPPGALAALAFNEHCSRCGACAAACPEAIIKADTEGFPRLDFSDAGCTFCGDCTNACETGALAGVAPWAWAATVSGTCLSRNGIACRTCQDRCDEGAIRFQLRPGGRADPLIDTDSCSGCGACIGACPVGAISLLHVTRISEVPTC